MTEDELKQYLKNNLTLKNHVMWRYNQHGYVDRSITPTMTIQLWLGEELIGEAILN